MATKKTFVEETLKRLSPLDVTARPMFGEYGLYFKGKFFGLICDDTLFIKVTEVGSAFAGRINKASPYPGAKLAFKISNQKANDRQWLTNLVEVTADALPPTKPRRR
jgi:TfoX/Sxy family transcriptional regulator of competence genes